MTRPVACVCVYVCVCVHVQMRVDLCMSMCVTQVCDPIQELRKASSARGNSCCSTTFLRQTVSFYLFGYEVHYDHTQAFEDNATCRSAESTSTRTP